MANILSLAMKVSADASGVVKNLTPAERALEKLGQQADKTTAVFDKFANDTQAAATAQVSLNQRFEELAQQLASGLNAEEYAKQFQALQQEVRQTADAFEEGARIIEANKPGEQQRAERLERLAELQRLGAIDEATYAAEVAKTSGAVEAAAAAERERLTLLERGATLAQRFATQDEIRAANLAEVDRLLAAAAISEEIAARARAEYSGANEEAARRQRELAEQQEQLARDQAAAERLAADESNRVQRELAAQQQQIAREQVAAERLAADESKRIQREALEEAREIGRIREESARFVAQAIAEAEREEAEKNAARTASALRTQANAYADAARIIEANLSPQEQYDRQIQELRGHLDAGRLSQEQFNRAAERASKDLQEVGKSASNADSTLTSMSKSLRILTTIEVGRVIFDGLQILERAFSRVATQILTLVSNVATSTDAFNDLSARTGIGIEALQGYSLAAKLAGVDTEQFGTAVQRLAVNIGKATPGDALDKALKGINLSLAELRALSPEQQFSEIGQAISQLPTAADRAAAAVAIFGKQGAALAPLFREGAASIEELQARAERLGIIISETQVNNVGDMNDAFDLVAATINGIVGQVIGNLAPAVTAVTNEFLRFVEEWSGAQGEGGTGIANAITDVLLEGASYFAAIFDKFVEEFGNLGEVFAFAADVFDVTSKVLLSVSEAFRVVFNVLQLGIDALIVGFGKVLQGLGSFVDSDLEEYGRALVDAGMESTERNSREMEAAAANAAETFNSIFTGGDGNAQQAGQGAASQFLAGLRAEIENARLPEVQVQANLASATAELDQFLSTAEGGASEFLQQSQATLATFSQMAAEGELTADQIEIMNGFMERLNGEITKERQLRQEAADAAQAQADADGKRLDQLLQTNDEAARIEQDLLVVQREQARVSEQLAAAREANNVAEADAAAARQGELDQLQGKLEDQQQALEQGFGQGFQAAFQAVDENINGLIAKSQEFGQAGFDAALRLQEGIAAAQEQASAGILNKEAFDAEVARQQELFNNEIENLEKIKKKKDDDAAEEKAKRDKAQEDALRVQGEYQRQQQQAAEAAANEQRRVQEQIFQYQQKVLEEQQKAAEAEAKRQEERLTKLNTLGSQTITGSDIRTAEGAALVLNLTANAQDPRLVQERLQTKLLERIATGIGQAASNYFNQPVAIVGYSSFGEPT